MEVILHCYTTYVEHRTLCKTKVILLHILKNTFEGAGWQSDQFEHKKLFILWCQGYLNTVCKICYYLKLIRGFSSK